MTRTDWSQWHEAYAQRGPGLAARLDVVRREIGRQLDETAPEPVRVVSACAGDGRDLLGVLAGRVDAGRVTALLVEADPVLAARAQAAAEDLGARVQVRQADAADSSVYAAAVPADLLLLCGIFGNVDDDDVRATIEAAPQLCRQGAEVIWTRHRGEPDLTPAVREWFRAAGFQEVAFHAPDAVGREGRWSVGVHRLVVQPPPLQTGRHWFTFVR